MLLTIPKIKLKDFVQISYKNIETGKISQYVGLCTFFKKKDKFYHIKLRINFDKNIVEITFIAPSPLIHKIEIIK